MHHFNSKQFSWKGHHGIAAVSDLIGRRALQEIGRFSITSAKTGQMRFYEIDTTAPGYTDGWDGEMRVFTDNLWDGTRITIIND